MDSAQGRKLAPFVGDMSQIEKLSEIKPRSDIIEKKEGCMNFTSFFKLFGFVEGSLRDHYSSRACCRVNWGFTWCLIIQGFIIVSYRVHQVYVRLSLRLFPS